MSNELSNNSKPAPTNRPRLAFMDAVEAAANLSTDRLGILKLIEEGRLKPYGGKTGNPFVRTDDVERLAQELNLQESQPVDPKVVHRNDPVRKLKLRIQQDAKWHEVDEAAMRAWAKELDLISYDRMRKVAQDAIGQLQLLVRVLNDVEAERK